MTDTTNVMETEVKEAEKTGVVDFNQKKEERKSDNYTHTFSKQVELGGKKYEKLTFYFENLTGEDIEKVEQELEQQNIYVIAPEVSSKFQAAIAARAAGVPVDDISRLPARDYLKIKNTARNFLTVAGF